jgi:hypothetical protein
MKKLTVLSVCLGSLFAAATSHAIDLKESKVTQVVNDVQIISAANQSQKTASVNDIFSMPDILRTGAASRAELVAADQTVTRVGANTIFSFDPESRTIDLKQGSLLFHSPHGKGGGSIHTGSATASVLGTTIVVVATQNGGFKVLVLEGIAEVQFLNGLKQKLSPGQMTFVLPGANQLAPIIIFRLDELTADSLLVKGFSQPLDSTSLIQQQIDKQLKAISSGKLGDTGLYAGDNANSVQVEVLDPNTISGNQNQPPPQPQQQTPPPQNPPPPPPPPPPLSLSAAEAADATINQPSLTDVSIPTPPQHVFFASFTVPDNNYFGPETFSGFVAQNIFVNTPAVALNPLTVNLKPYGILPEFDLVADNNFSIEGSVVFDGLATSEDFQLVAGNQFILTPGITIEAEANTFTMSSLAAMDFNDVGLVNNTKDIDLNSGDTITFENGATVTAKGRIVASAENGISANNSQFNVGTAQFGSLNGGISFENSTLTSKGFANFTAPATIGFDNSTINADSVLINGTTAANVTINNTAVNANSSIAAFSVYDLDVTGSSPAPSVANQQPAAVDSGSGLYVDPSSGSVTLSSSLGSVIVQNTSITAHMLTLNSGDGILLDGSGHTVTASGAGSVANFTAPNQITVNNTDFSSWGVVNMAANTIVLAYDTFSTTGTYNFGTQNGSVVINGANPGGLALDYCLLGSTPITSVSQVNLSSGPGHSAGIYSYAK